MIDALVFVTLTVAVIVTVVMLIAAANAERSGDDPDGDR